MTKLTRPRIFHPTEPARTFHALLPLGLALIALLVSLFFHCPRLWVMARPMPDSTYWHRGLQFMQQCDAPIGAPLGDAGLVWRLAPALLAKIMGLHGMAVFVVPWLGLLLLLALCAAVVMRRTGDVTLAMLSTVLIGTTGAALTVTGWLGMNDAWYASALAVVAFQPTLSWFVPAALIGPWIDERFVLALPLALYVRSVAMGRDARLWPALGLAGGSVILYLIVRGFNLPHISTGSFEDYKSHIFGHFLEWWPWTSLGWFMGLRAAWFLIAVAIGGKFQRNDLPSLWRPAILASMPLIIFNFLAADTGRSGTMLLPLILLGVERVTVLWDLAYARRLLAILVIVNVLLPAMQVTHRGGDIINSFPVELFRILHH